MKIIILGAGVIGVTTAYYLAKSGNEVVVIDKESSCGLGCSYANGGQLSYSHIDTWSAKLFIKAFLKGLIFNSSSISIADFSNKNFYIWFKEFFNNSHLRNANKNAFNLAKISFLSKNLLDELFAEQNDLISKKSINYKNDGILHFYRDKDMFNHDKKKFEYFKNYHISSENLNPEECISKEIELKKLFDKKQLFGGIFFKEDASANCLDFTKRLAKIAEEKYGVVFKYNYEIKNILTNYEKITGINTNKEVLKADNYIYCLGAYSLNLLNGINIKTKIYPIKGHSLSINCNNNYKAPNLSLTDSQNKIVYSRFNDVFRVAGTAQMKGYNLNIDNKNINFLKNNLKEVFANYGDLESSKYWCGIRPYRPNSTPLVGKIDKLQNLYLNVGHGSLGWTNSLACAFIINNIINNNEISNDFDFLINDIKNVY